MNNKNKTLNKKQVNSTFSCVTLGLVLCAQILISQNANAQVYNQTPQDLMAIKDAEDRAMKLKQIALNSLNTGVFNEMPGNPWIIVHGDLEGADLMAYHNKQNHGQIVRVMGAHLFHNTIQFQLELEGKKTIHQADYMRTVIDYRCTTPGVYRLRNESYYILNNANAVYNSGYHNQSWQTSKAGSTASKMWQIACKDALDETMLSVDKITGKYKNSFDEVFMPMRDQIKNSRKKAGLD